MIDDADARENDTAGVTILYAWLPISRRLAQRQPQTTTTTTTTNTTTTVAATACIGDTCDSAKTASAAMTSSRSGSRTADATGQLLPVAAAANDVNGTATESTPHLYRTPGYT